MKCGITNCAQGDNRHLWHCYGLCNRTFHAACIGAQRNHEEVLRTFMLPLCHDCQERFLVELNLKAFAASLSNISANMEKTLETNHKLVSSYKHLSATHDDALEYMEKTVTEIKQLTVNATNSNKASTAEIKQTLSQLKAPGTPTAVEASSAATSAVVSIIRNELTNLKIEVEKSHATLAGDIKSSMKDFSQSTATTQSTSTSTEIETSDIEDSGWRTIKNKRDGQPTAKTPAKDSKHSQTYESAATHAHTSPGWRFLGDKWRWKPNWTEFDEKQRLRRVQNKNELIARRKRKHQQQQQKRQQQQQRNNGLRNGNIPTQSHTSSNDDVIISITNKNSSNNNNNNNNNNINNKILNTASTHSALSLDKELLAAARVQMSDKQLLASAKVQFAGPPSSIEHPIAGLSVPTIINFRKGETINPYPENRTQYTNTQQQLNTTPPEAESSPTSIPPPGWSLDPMRPPIVNITQKSANGDGRFLKARLRDPRIMHVVRLYLAFMHDKDASVCHEGMTNTSIKMFLASEGLPVSADELRKIFFEVHEELGESPQAASNDLESYRRYLGTQRIQYMQRARESAANFRK